jgi:hypothetical protein
MSSNNRAALSAILRAPQLGQKPRRLQLNATSFCHQFFVTAGLTANPQKSMFKPSAFQVLFKFLRDVVR